MKERKVKKKQGVDIKKWKYKQNKTERDGYVHRRETERKDGMNQKVK